MDSVRKLLHTPSYNQFIRADYNHIKQPGAQIRFWRIRSGWR